MKRPLKSAITAICAMTLVSVSVQAQERLQVAPTAIVDKYATMVGNVLVLELCGYAADGELLRKKMDAMIAEDFPRTAKDANDLYTFWAGYIRGMRSALSGVAGFANTTVNPGSCTVLRMETRDALQR